MLLKLLKFLKNLHPIKNFARPINAPRHATSILAFSYEALTQDLQETSNQSRLETTASSFQEQQTYNNYWQHLLEKAFMEIVNYL